MLDSRNLNKLSVLSVLLELIKVNEEQDSIINKSIKQK